jgi:hypothetical protein
MTIGVPLLNGSLQTQGERFAEHGFTVVIFSIIILGVLLGARKLWKRTICRPVMTSPGHHPVHTEKKKVRV